MKGVLYSGGQKPPEQQGKHVFVNFAISSMEEQLSDKQWVRVRIPHAYKKRKPFPVNNESALKLGLFRNQVFMEAANFYKVHKQVMQRRR